jgi:hypothetical protein
MPPHQQSKVQGFLLPVYNPAFVTPRLLWAAVRARGTVEATTFTKYQLLQPFWTSATPDIQEAVNHLKK